MISSVLAAISVLLPLTTTIQPVGPRSGWIHAPAIIDVQLGGDLPRQSLRYWSNEAQTETWSLKVDTAVVLLGDPHATCTELVSSTPFPSGSFRLIVAVEAHPGSDLFKPNRLWTGECLVQFNAIAVPSEQKRASEWLSDIIFWREQVLMSPLELAYLFESGQE